MREHNEGHNDLDQRFDALVEHLEKWSEETMKMMGSDTRQSHPTAGHLDLKTIRWFRTVFGKWSLEIVGMLVATGRVRFEELRRTLAGISSHVLSQKLKALEEAGFVKRTILESRPPRALYELSERGAALVVLGRPAVLFLIADAAKDEILCQMRTQ